MRRASIVDGKRTKCFNPRICKRCDLEITLISINIAVSIHASVKDATTVSYSFDFKYDVSIHASVKDATAAYAKTLAETKFQSTHL